MKLIFKNKSNRTFDVVIVIMSVFLLGILIQSCNQDDFEIVDNSTPLSVLNNVDTKVDFSSRIVNPYDFTGKYHNEGLQFVIDEYRKFPQSNTRASLDRQIEDLTILYMSENDIFTFSDIETSTDMSNLIILDKVTFDQIRLKNENLFQIEAQQLYFNRLVDVFKRNITSPQVLIDYINEIEYDVINDQTLTEVEKSPLLITSAVAKYSSIFWIEFLLKDERMIGRKVRLKDGTESGWDFGGWFQKTFMPSLEQVVQADFTGAAVGAVTGALLGGAGGTIAAPGAGTITIGVTGAVVGGAQGAIGSSAFEGIQLIFF